MNQTQLSAQENDARATFEVGLGSLFFLGDLGGGLGVGTKFIKDVNLPLASFNFSIGACKNISPLLSIKTGLTIGQLKGNDQYAPKAGGSEEDRQKRNLSFKTAAFEIYCLSELYPLDVILKRSSPKTKKIFSILMGAGVLKFNPKTQRKSGEWVYLKPLCLEGQGFSEYPDRKPYSLFQPVVIMGGALRIQITHRFYLKSEILHRISFTDYIDDVSTTYINPDYFSAYFSAEKSSIARELAYREKENNQQINRVYEGEKRGNKSNTDAYFSANILIGFSLNNNRYKHNILNQIKCPIW